MQPYFPASYATLSADALAILISEKYPVRCTGCSLIVRGVGDTYMADTTDGPLILRIYRADQRDLLQITEESDVLLAFHTSGISVSHPVADNYGAYIQHIHSIDGTRHAVLFTYAAGRSVQTFKNAQLFNLGSEMARMHNVSTLLPVTGSRWNYDLATTLFSPLEILKTAFAEDADTYAWLLQAAKQVERKMATLNTPVFSKGYCHYDMLAKNFHFDDDNKVTFFDFDFMGTGWLINDVMTFWTQLCIDVLFGRITQEVADQSYQVFLDGYRVHHLLSKDELVAVPYLSLGFWLFYSAFHTTHDQFYSFIHPSQLKHRFTFVKKLMEKYWEAEYLPKL